MNKILPLILFSCLAFSSKAQLVEYNDKVGIGVTQPVSKLDVAGTTFLRASAGAGQIAEQLRFGRYDRAIRYHSIYTEHNSGADNNFLQFRLHNGGSDPYLDQNTVMTLFGDGKIGVGTMTPFAKMHVSHTHTIGGRWDPYNSSIAISNPDDNSMLIMDPNEIYGKSGLHIGVVSGDIKFRSVGSSSYKDHMVIRSNGAVGIGTSSTGSHKLAVEGTIGAREVKVESGSWSDFVFEEDYKLPSLKDVESFVKQHKHLPDIPNEEEVKREGIELGKMDAKLLQKIEELTLYIIQQQKEIESLKSKVEQLNKTADEE